MARFLTNRILYWALVAKVQVFFEGQKNLKESPTLESNLIQENMHEIFFSKFVAFSEYPNFRIRLDLGVIQQLRGPKSNQF